MLPITGFHSCTVYESTAPPVFIGSSRTRASAASAESAFTIRSAPAAEPSRMSGPETTSGPDSACSARYCRCAGRCLRNKPFVGSFRTGIGGGSHLPFPLNLPHPNRSTPAAHLYNQPPRNKNYSEYTANSRHIREETGVHPYYPIVGGLHVLKTITQWGGLRDAAPVAPACPWA